MWRGARLNSRNAIIFWAYAETRAAGSSSRIEHWTARKSRCLSRGGVFVANVCGDLNGCAAHVGKIRTVFGDEIMTLQVRPGGNLIVFAFKERRPQIDWKQLAATAVDLKRKFGLDFPRYVRRIALNCTSRRWQPAFVCGASNCWHCVCDMARRRTDDGLSVAKQLVHARLEMTSQCELLAMPAPFPLPNSRVLLLEPPGRYRHELSRQLLDVTSDKPFILDCGALRYLHFDFDKVQSLMRCDDPDALCLRYTRKMMSFLLFNPEPRRILILGLGGGSLVKFCYRHLPSARITAIEIDPYVIVLREEFRVPKDDERFCVLQGDGTRYVTFRGPRQDVILLDTYDRHGAAAGLQRRLTVNGVLVTNIHGDAYERASEFARIRAVFGKRVIALPVREDGNLIVLAFRTDAALRNWAQRERLALALKERFGLNFSRFVRKMTRSPQVTALRAPAWRPRAVATVGPWPSAAAAPCAAHAPRSHKWCGLALSLCDHHLGACDLCASHERIGQELQRVFGAAFKVRAEQQLIAWHNRLAKTSFVQPHQIKARSLLHGNASRHEGQDASGLHQRFDDDYAGHQRPGREMPGKKGLVVSHILEGTDALPRMNIQHSVDEKKGVTLRKSRKNRADVEAERINHCCHPRSGAPAARSEFGPAPRCAPKQRGGPSSSLLTLQGRRLGYVDKYCILRPHRDISAVVYQL
jgi:spermidine synthase